MNVYVKSHALSTFLSFFYRIIYSRAVDKLEKLGKKLCVLLN